MSGQTDTPNFFDADLPRQARELAKKRRAPARAADVPGGSGGVPKGSDGCGAVEAHAIPNRRGGKHMAKKAAKGGKKKGGKKR